MDPVPASDQLIAHVYHGLRSRVPSFPSFQYGFLYGTNSTKRRVVGIPVRSSKLKSFSDLAINAWVPFGAGRGVKSPRRVKVAHYPPSSRLLLKRAFTIIFVPQSRRSSQPLNNNGSLGNTRPWHGNILVIKHGKRKPFINVKECEGDLVDNIVSTWQHIHLGTPSAFMDNSLTQLSDADVPLLEPSLPTIVQSPLYCIGWPPVFPASRFRRKFLPRQITFPMTPTNGADHGWTLVECEEEYDE
ncbi:hypothetical protein C8J57DRAFT_1213435 [Mycena rebaudengoi]|nr:hypothetical protein C8J57DRAFT_1213435 [Mycena rebaudengoi]